MKLFGKKKKDENEGISLKPSSKDFDIDDIDLPPLPDSEDSSDDELEFSNKMPKNEDLPPLPDPPKPYYPSSLPQKHPSPQEHPLQNNSTMPERQVMRQPQTPQMPRRPPQQMQYDKSDTSNRNNVKAPVFVKVDKYKEVLGVIDDLKKDLKDLNKSLTSLKNSKNKEDEIVSGWNGLLSEAASKLDKIDSGLFEPEE